MIIYVIQKTIYKRKIEEKMIPAPVLKMIKENKFLNEELQNAKNA